MMIKEIKSGMISGLVFLITASIGGIIYAATTLTATQNEPLTAEKWNNLVSNTSRISGEIAAFDLTTCPAGWSEYTPAYGRFLRGIDRSGTSTDTDGERLNGDIQEDMFKTHTHTSNFQYYKSYGSADSNLAHIYTNGASGIMTSNAAGGLETRPKNVAVLFCRKN